MKIDSIDINNSFTRFNNNQRIDFSKKDNNCIFIYGPNGTGKSSLSKLFSISNMKVDGDESYKEKLLLLKTIDSPHKMSVSICYNDETSTIFTDDISNPQKIPVFNKNYIDSRITYQSDFKNNKIQEQTLNYGIELESKTNYNKKLAEVEENNKNGTLILEKINKQIELGILQTIKDTGTKSTNQKYIYDYNLKSFMMLNADEIPTEGLDKLRDEYKKYIINLKGYTKRPKDITDMRRLEPFIDKEKLAQLSAHPNHNIEISNICNFEEIHKKR